MWSNTGPAEEEHNFSPRGQRTLLQEIQRLEKTKQNRIPANCARCSSTAVVKVEEGIDAETCNVMPSTGGRQSVGASKELQEGKQKTSNIVGKKSIRKPRARRLNLTVEDLKSDPHLRLKDKAAKLRVSMTTFKNRRKENGLGRWPGRAERARIKHE